MNKNFSERHLPHLHFNEGIYFITSRIYDPNAIEKFKSPEPYKIPASKGDFETFKNYFIEYDGKLEKLTGVKFYLKNPAVAQILMDCIFALNGKEFKIIALTIMPNHFHLLIELLPGNSGLSKIMQLIKGRSAFYINRHLSLKGKCWQDESYDRLVRDDVELYFIIRYILLNPVAAGLVKNWYEWQFTYCNEKYNVL